MALEKAPDNADLMTELFRFVHTLKGNSGLFEFPEMTRVLHAAEDLMTVVRDGCLGFSRELADSLLDAMDFVLQLIDEIEEKGSYDAACAEKAQKLTERLRALIPIQGPTDVHSEGIGAKPPEPTRPTHCDVPPLAHLPEAIRLKAFRAAPPEVPLLYLRYKPAADSFYKGEDPFYQARQTPGLVWGRALGGPWPALVEMDCYASALTYEMLVRAPRSEVVQHYRYTPEEIEITEVPLTSLVVPQGDTNGGPVHGDFIVKALKLLESKNLCDLKAAAVKILEASAPELCLSSALRWLIALIDVAPVETEAMAKLIHSLETFTAPEWENNDFRGLVAQGLCADERAEQKAVPTRAPLPTPACALDTETRALLDHILDTQAEILRLPDGVDWLPGRLVAVASTLKALFSHLGEDPSQLEEALAEALTLRSARPLAQWLAAWRGGQRTQDIATAEEPGPQPLEPNAVTPSGSSIIKAPAVQNTSTSGPAFHGGTTPKSRGANEDEPKFGRRAEDSPSSRVLKVDQARVDRLMNLIGEMVVAKNSLPYLAKRAEEEYGMRELAREIKAQYAVINRIAEEMQDAIMQVRMVPLSFVFQRFPRLVRDISRKLGKEVDLVIEGEETEVDKNLVEALGDPLIHIVRNSLDHGLETPEARAESGKPEKGRLLIRARQDSDRAIIEISDDGRGIDPSVIKRKAYERGLISEEQLDRVSDQEAIQLIFLPGFSTAEQVSDLSGRGVGMDVVKNALTRVGGTVQLTSKVGLGTTLVLSLPLSMAVTNVMIVESDRQIFGVPMEQVVETVRLPRAEIRSIKQSRTAVLRGRVVPILALNELLSIPAEPLVNAEEEFAVLVVRIDEEPVGLLVDDFREVIDVIVKPMPGELGRLSCYAGTALLGDGSVLMVINPKELMR